MHKDSKNKLIHVLGSILFLSLPFLFSPELTGHFNFFYNPGIHRAFISTLLLLLFFYLNYYVLIPQYYISKKYFIYILLILICFLLFFAVPDLHKFWRPYLIQHSTTTLLPPPPIPFILMLSQRLLEFLGVFVFSLLLKLRERLKLIEVEKANAELAYLKAQINPHFLFNTLNSIYSLALHNNSKTAESIVKLSDMMRYVLNESNYNEVLVSKEKEYIFNFIELQILRLSPSIKLSCSWEGESNQLTISPLLIIPFIENAFKHGVNSEEDSEISIQIVIIKSELHLQVKNKIVTENNATLEKSGIGIVTTKRRLDLLYPEKHSLTCLEKDGWYCVDLKIDLND